MDSILRLRTVSLIGKFLRPLADEGLMTVPELNEVATNLRHLATKGTLLPAIPPRLINSAEAAELLGISLAHFKKFEREGRLPFKRRTIGTSVRYRNADVFKFILSDDDLLNNDQAIRETSIEKVLNRCSPPESRRDMRTQ
jgi:predicted DNA-binding transcriptional regulator AlpA